MMTTGYYNSILEEYCESLDLPLHITFVKNSVYDKTNYIYSIYCAREYLDDDILLMHGDLVFENTVFDDVLASNESCMTVSSTLPLPEKDFKAVLSDGRITKVGIEFFENAVAAQPLYKLNKNDWKVWLDRIIAFCESDNTKCYEENAFNEVSESCKIVPLNVQDRLCAEIDNPDDLKSVSEQLKDIENRTVYMCFSTDIIHSGHIAIINKAKRYGKLMIGLLTDETIVSYKRYPLVPYSERKSMLENIVGVYRVVKQDKLSYKENLEEYKPDYVVYGDDWKSGFQQPIREEVISVLNGCYRSERSKESRPCCHQ